MVRCCGRAAAGPDSSGASSRGRLSRGPGLHVADESTDVVDRGAAAAADDADTAVDPSKTGPGKLVRRQGFRGAMCVLVEGPQGLRIGHDRSLPAVGKAFECRTGDIRGGMHDPVDVTAPFHE